MTERETWDLSWHDGNKTMFESIGIGDTKWALGKDGTLSVYAQGRVVLDTFPGPMRKIRRLVIAEGGTEIPDFFLRECPELTEVELPESLAKVGFGAFSDCPRLAKVMLGNPDTEIGRGAFAHTPYNGDTLPAEDGGTLESPGAHLDATEQGRKLIAELKKLADHGLYEVPAGTTYDEYYTEAYADGWQACIDIVRAGAESGDVALMRLWGEALLWAGPKGFVFPLDSHVWDTASMALECDDDPFSWFERASDAGDVRATLWIAWCHLMGLGVECDVEKARELMERAQSLPRVEALEPPELHFLIDGMADLGELSHDLDIEEDMRWEEGVSFPWRDIFMASWFVRDIGAALGLSSGWEYVPMFDYGYDDDFPSRFIAAEKSAWTAWCCMNGLGIEKQDMPLVFPMFAAAQEMKPEKAYESYRLDGIDSHVRRICAVAQDLVAFAFAERYLHSDELLIPPSVYEWDALELEWEEERRQQAEHDAEVEAARVRWSKFYFDLKELESGISSMRTEEIGLERAIAEKDGELATCRFFRAGKRKQLLAEKEELEAELEKLSAAKVERETEAADVKVKRDAAYAELKELTDG